MVWLFCFLLKQIEKKDYKMGRGKEKGKIFVWIQYFIVALLGTQKKKKNQ
jgi:hypothetical protein